MLAMYFISQMLFSVAKLGVADALAEKPLAPDALAKRVGAHAPFLRRVLRALASVGVFAEDSRGRFRLTPIGQTLRADRPGSLRDFALMLPDDYNWQAFGALPFALEAGGSAFEHVHGMPTFDYLKQHPEKELAFAASMASISDTDNAAIARAYAFGRFAKLVDVGGAHGHLLATILRRHKKLNGVLYDQPQVVGGAKASGFVDAADVRERIELAGGSFFESVPSGADGYLMKYIIHDWDDEKAMRILGQCRDAMTPEGRVLVVDHVIPQGNSPDWGKLLDVMMMVGPGGQERTREEFRALFARVGLRLARVIPTACPLSILEAVRA
ncbi:MAG: methyltransferase [Myxococcota bacterium]